MSERDPEPQTDCPSAVHAFLREGLQFLSKVFVGSDVGNQSAGSVVNHVEHRLQGVRVYCNVEVTQESERTATAAVVVVRREQWVIEHVVHIRAECGNHTLSKMEVLVNAQVDSPRARPAQQTPFCNLGIVEDIPAERHQGKCIWIPDL